MVQHTTAGFLQRLFLLLSGIAPTCFIGVTPLQLAVCVVSGADGTQATPESEYCTGTHSRPMRIHRETFAKTLEWETHVFCRGCWAGRWMPETADGHPCFSLREWSAEIEAKEKENTAERERERESQRPDDIIQGPGSRVISKSELLPTLYLSKIYFWLSQLELHIQNSLIFTYLTNAL